MPVLPGAWGMEAEGWLLDDSLAGEHPRRERVVAGMAPSTAFGVWQRGQQEVPYVGWSGVHQCHFVVLWIEPRSLTEGYP